MVLTILAATLALELVLYAQMHARRPVSSRRGRRVTG